MKFGSSKGFRPGNKDLGEGTRSALQPRGHVGPSADGPCPLPIRCQSRSTLTSRGMLRGTVIWWKTEISGLRTARRWAYCRRSARCNFLPFAQKLLSAALCRIVHHLGLRFPHFVTVSLFTFVTSCPFLRLFVFVHTYSLKLISPRAKKMEATLRSQH